MIFGLYFTIIVAVILSIVFVYLYSYLHTSITYSILIFGICGIIDSLCETLNVSAVLDFNYKILTISEAVGFTANTFVQFFLIRMINVDPVLSFGLSALVSRIFRILVYLTYYKREYKIDLNLSTFEYKGKEIYVFPDTKKLALQLSYLPLISNYGDQFYFMFFLAGKRFVGELSLIKSLGALFTRFVFSPVDVSYLFYLSK